MFYYHYIFTSTQEGSRPYHIYAPSKSDAEECYLKEHDLKELPKGVTIERRNN